MNFTITCPSCQRTLRVPEKLLGQAVKCPSCEEIFTTPAAIEKTEPPLLDAQLPRLPISPPPEYDDEEEMPRRRRRRKPGKVQAIAIMILVGGVLATFSAVVWLAYMGIIGVATMGLGFLCCLWPGPYFGLVLGIMAIIKGSRLLGENASGETPPHTIGTMMIINIVNLDVVNLTLGIIVLVFLSEGEVKDYFRNDSAAPR